MNRNYRRMLSTLAGVGVLGLAGSVAALAQDNTTNAPAQTNSTSTSTQSSTPNSSMPMNNMGMNYDTNYDWMAGNPTWMTDPAPVNYPFAAPGAIDMYHFRGYEGINLEPLSAEDVRYQQQVQQGMMMHRSSAEEDETMIDPAPISYPFAAPGQTDMYHFRSYRGLDFEPGSVEDVRYQRQLERDKKWADEMKQTRAMVGRSEEEEDEEMAEPTPVKYPFAAPGSVDMYHFHSYRGIDVRPQSATDVHSQKEMNKDLQQKQQMQNNNTNSGNTGNTGSPK